MAKSSTRSDPDQAKKVPAKKAKKAAKVAPVKPSKSSATKPAKVKKGAATAKKKVTYRKTEEVKALILAAAAELFSERMPADVSVRDIAERAGVQHSLVHRHFETKERLLAEIIISNRLAYSEAVASATDAADGFIRALDYLAVNRTVPLAIVSVIAGRAEPDESQSFYPGFDRHLQQVLAAGATEDEHTRIFTALVMALVLGWSVLEEFLMNAAHLNTVGKQAVHAEIAETIDRMITQYLEEQQS